MYLSIPASTVLIIVSASPAAEIAIIHRYNDVEEKWVVSPENCSFTREMIREQVYFQEQYFDTQIQMANDDIE